MSKRFILLVFLYWILGINLIAVYLLESMYVFIDMAELDINTLPSQAKYWFNPFQYLESSLFAVLFSALFLIIHQFAERREIGRMSFGKIILTKSLFYIVGFVLIFILIYVLMVPILGVYPDNALDDVEHSNSITFSLSAYFVVLFVMLVFLNFIIQASKTFGQTNLLNFITGKYHTPQIEDRVFLFIDLKDSTVYAEELGNIKYSMLIKDCFEDFNVLVSKHKAEIHQYVGDEILVTWLSKDTIKTPYCVDLFFDFAALLNKRSEYYTNKYGFVPEFKAGVNGGVVTATEIGDIKRDIAYHGDVLNTASRIQGKCNEFAQVYLIDAKLLDKLGDLEKYDSTHIGNVKLKGKHDATDIYALNLKK